jgi:predicted HTH transcriptional regulator
MGIMVELNEGDRILRSKSQEYLQNTQEWKIEHFYKGHTSEIRKIMKELSANEKAFLFSIATYIGYEDCCLKYDNGENITSEDLIQITNLGRTTVFDVISSLIKKDILYKGRNSKNRQYFINPWLFCKGNRINKVLKTMFQNYRIRILEGKRWKDVKHD